MAEKKVPSRKDRSYKRATIRTVTSKADDLDVLSKRTVDDTDPFLQIYDTERLLTPPYSFPNLWQIYEQSDVLQTCADAMKRNIDGFGYQLQFLGDDKKVSEDAEAMAEKVMAENFFDYANEKQSWRTLRMLAREDMEALGNAAFELVRNVKNEIVLAYHSPFKNLRISATLGKQITVPITIMRKGKPVKIKVKKHFRKFCQIRSDGKKLRWFKEFGDPRFLDALDGKYKKTIKDCKILATEIWWHKMPFGSEVYGIPRWIGAVLQAMGRRNAQFVNYDLFEHQGIPPMAIMVSGGVLNDESLEELEQVLRDIRGADNWNRVVILLLLSIFR